VAAAAAAASGFHAESRGGGKVFMLNHHFYIEKHWLRGCFCGFVL
jgi:hypothetical protein